MILILLLVTSTARAFILAGPEPSLDRHTVEALTAISPLIVTATIDKPTVFGEIELLTLDTLKAPAGFVAPKPFVATFDPINRPDGPWPPPGTKVLIFLSPPHVYPPAWEIYDYVVLDRPGAARSANARVIRDLTLNPVPGAQAVLDIVRQELRRTPPTIAVETYPNYPFHLECLPPDDRLLPAARRWAHSTDPLARLLAVSVMQAHPDPQDNPLLTSLLQDPYTYDMPIGLSPWSGHEYSVRQAAARALTARSAAFLPPVLATPRHDLYQPFSFVSLVVLIAVASIVYVGVRWITCGKTNRNRLSLKSWIISYLTFLCLMLALLTACQWYRSLTIIDDLIRARNGTQIEITSLRGFFLIVEGKPFPAETPLVHLSLQPDAIPAPPDDEYFWERQGLCGFSWKNICDLYRYRPHVFQFALGIGFGKARDITIEPFSTRSGIRETYSGSVFACAYQTLTLIFLALPLLRLLLALISRIRRFLRNRTLRKAGLCPSCAYDLRAHHPGERCPECGTVIVRPVARSPVA